MNTIKLLLLIISLPLLLIPDAQAQSLTYTTTDNSHIIVSGTSTLHDWELRSSTLMSEAVFSTGNGETIESLESVMMILETSTLESDRSRLENLAHEEMDAGNHPEITFRSAGNGRIQRDGDAYRVTAPGDLTIAGVTRQVSVEATCINTADEMLVCTGTRDLLMTDFGIDPPTLMLGTIRTADEVTVEFRMEYSR
jgi:polyisoprenoid-binding protein YceI